MVATEQRSSKKHGHRKSSAYQTQTDIGHLMRRAGFGEAPAVLRRAASAGLPATINALVDFDQTPDTLTPAPNTLLDTRAYRSDTLAQWWAQQMVITSRPLQEKMTVFWHGHFATGIQKVGSEVKMYRQNQLFRTLGMGRFDDLLSAVYKDPAMLRWLDGERNTKFAPNENWGREVLELFTLGHGNYTEDDVHASSRAFTGWRVAPDGQAVFVPRLHDVAEKTLLGQTGNWDSEDAVRILAAHPDTGRFLATRMWKFFASEKPPTFVVDKLARVYDQSNHSIREILRELFLLPDFYSPATRTGHVKSPVEFVVSTIRQLGLSQVDLTTIPRVLTFLGQELFNPPNVGGWPGGLNWLNAATILVRFNFASSLTGDIVPARSVIDPAAIVEASNAFSMHDLVYYVADVLGITLSTETASALLHFAGQNRLDRTDAEGRLRGLVHLALISPEYQVS
ncbi:MAG: DUF1800 domain-containing protein [Chloroflexota bacterium]|nr:MAG: DUF1800 domain-containing protein [Chloroflexota bacterium]